MLFLLGAEAVGEVIVTAALNKMHNLCFQGFIVLTNELLHKKDSIVDNFGYGILLYIRKMPYFCPFTAHLGGFEGVYSYISDKSAIFCPVGIEVTDLVSFKGSIVHRISIERMGEI